MRVSSTAWGGSSLEKRLIGTVTTPDISPSSLLAGVEARAQGFVTHGLGRFFERQEDPDGGLLAVHRAHQITDVPARDLARLHLHEHALRTRAAVEEVFDPVYPPVSALFSGLAARLVLAERLGRHQGQSSPLELVAAVFGELLGTSDVLGFAYDLYRYTRKHVLHPVLL